MKIALAQLNYHIGHFEKNEKLIINAITKAKAAKAELVVFSELCICGYPPHDLLERKEFVEECVKSVERIATQCTDIAALVGGPAINPNNKGKKLFNAAFFLNEGKIEQTFYKSLLPTYDVFDEYRYFEPNTAYDILEYKGKKMAVTICEDIWENQPVANPFAQNRLYANSPMEKLIEKEPEIILNIASSPFSYVQEGTRKGVLRHNAEKYKIPVVYVNQVGANTELVFDGNSMVYNSDAQLCVQCDRFVEDLQFVETDSLTPIKEITVEAEEDYHIPLINDALVLGIKDYFGKMGFKQATLGLSGGIDSAVVVVLAVEALGAENVRVLLMPSQFSSDHSVEDAIALANNLGIQYEIIAIKEVYDKFEQALKPIFKDLPFNVAEENLQARIRGTLMMGLSNKFGHILLNTTNKSEAAVGYGTLYGDMNGGMSVLGDVYKTDVFKLSRYMNRNAEVIPVNTIVKPPSAELRPDQKDSDSLPDYDTLDGILYNYIELNRSPQEIASLGYDMPTITKTIRLVNMNEYKRFQMAPILRVSSKAFGFGRRIPLVAKY